MRKIIFIFSFLALSIASKGQCNSWDGPPIGINPNSKIRTLNIFINVIYDVNPQYAQGDSKKHIYNGNYVNWANVTNPNDEGVNNVAIPTNLTWFMDTVYNPNN